ncbi:MAG: uncharacterized protein A8A55_3231, partial [Amphiamblys sp. WSBS2006]
FLKLIKPVHEGENVAPRKIKKLVFIKSSFFNFLEETRRIPQGKIHVEDLLVTQNGKESWPKTGTSTRIVVNKKIDIRGKVRVLQFIELGPELNHLDIDELKRQCLSPEIVIPRINIQLTKNKIIIREDIYVLQFLKKNITAAEVGFFTSKGRGSKRTKLTLVAEKMESILFRSKGLSVLLGITNEKINTGYMAVMDTVGCFSDQEKEEAKKKEFVIREKLYMKNTGIFFMELLKKTVFIPVIEIEIDCCTEDWGWFEETTGIHVETNALLWKISSEIKDTGEIKQKIGEMITQKDPVVKSNSSR